MHEITYKENLAVGSKDAYIKAICYLLKDVGGNKSLKELTAQDVELYLQGHQKPKYLDPKQRWISTHNMRAGAFIKFFRWLYYPDLPAKKRPKPDVIKNVVAYQKPEATNVEAKDLWTAEEDRTFLKYCLDPRMAWYHTASDDTSGRPHEILAKRFSDVKIKAADGKFYGEVEIGRGGNTKSRTVPLIRSLPLLEGPGSTKYGPSIIHFQSQQKWNERKKLSHICKDFGVAVRQAKARLFPPNS